MPNVIKISCARPQYGSALLRRTLRPSTPYACGTWHSLLPVAVGAMNIQCTQQTDVRRASSLNASALSGRRHNKRTNTIKCASFLTTFKTRPLTTYKFTMLLLSCMELTLLIQVSAHAQVCLFLMCFRSLASTLVPVKLLVEYSNKNYSVSAALL